MECLFSLKRLCDMIRNTVMAALLVLLKRNLCLNESRIAFWFKSFILFECIGTINGQPFSMALFASSSSECDVDDEFDESFLKRRLLPRNKTLPRRLIVHSKSAKGKKRNYNSTLINAIIVTKPEHSIHSRLERSVECGWTDALFYSFSKGYVKW